jgi:hypothetical protein
MILGWPDEWDVDLIFLKKKKKKKKKKYYIFVELFMFSLWPSCYSDEQTCLHSQSNISIKFFCDLFLKVQSTSHLPSDSNNIKFE